MSTSTPPPPRAASAISMPIAVMVAGALIGLGLFFGLRSQPEAPREATPSGKTGAAPPAASAATSFPAPAPIDTGAPATAAAPTKAVDQKAAAAQARAALDAHKKMIVETCVAPSLAKKPMPATVKLSFNFSFDASGKQITRGISEDRETSRADVTQCIQSKLPAITISAPGAGVFVEGIDWVLP